MRKSRIFFFLLQFFAAACLSLSAFIAFRQIKNYMEALTFFPPGTWIGGIPAGGLTSEQAALRIAQAYALTPVEIKITEREDNNRIISTVQISPILSGQRLEIGTMIEQAEERKSHSGVWLGFWDYLWNRPISAIEIPLICSVDDQVLLQYLQSELPPRYEQPATNALPVPGDVIFLSGQPGTKLNIDGAIPTVKSALCSLDSRSVEISITKLEPLPPNPNALKPTLDAIIQGSGFDGILELYFKDLQTEYEFTTAFSDSQPIQPGIAFTAASTIKIPVMVSVFKKEDRPLSAGLRQELEQMIDLSDNTSTDEVMRSVLDENLAPIQVTDDIRALGLNNTFLAGFFYPGAPLLELVQTPANERTDIFTDPDVYNQTTAAEMGTLLGSIYQCAKLDKGPIINAFSGQITQDECNEMVDLLSKNRKGVLLEAGLPEGTRIARKYGWVTDPNDGLMHSASDAAIIFTSGGDFVITVYLYHPDQLQWDPAQRLVARLATAVDNYFNQWK